MASEAVQRSEGESFATLLRRHREVVALSQEALAARAGLSTRAISDLERGVKTRPYLDTVRRLAGALGLDPAAQAELAAAARRPPSAAASQAADATRKQPVRPGLPVPPTPLVGREHAIAQLIAMVREGARLVTLTGPGGIGKTRLALAAAAVMVEEYADEVVWVELAPLNDPALVSSAVAQAVGVQEVPNQDISQTLANLLSTRQLTLVLDNCEHLRAAVGQVVSPLLAHCTDLRVLATSRAPLHIGAEQLFPVSPLALPDPTAHYQLETVAEADAVQLFVQRTQAVRPDFALTDQNANDVAVICTRLDGLPLALTLAAARLRSLSPAALRSLLDERLRLLSGGSADAPVRHQTLRATISWSYDLLTPGQQRFFRQLAVFAGGATLEAVADVCTAGDPFAALEALEGLIDQSLVVETESADGAPRYSMLETIRAFAVEQLTAGGEAAAETRDRHAAWFLEFAESLEPEVDSPQHVTVVARLRAEYPNFRMALNTFRQQGDAGAALRLSRAMFPLWQATGRVREAVETLGEMLSLPGASAPTPARAKALAAAGEAAIVHGDFIRAEAWLNEAVAISEVESQASALALSLYWLGCIAMFRADYDASHLLSTRSLAMARQAGDERVAAAALWSLGYIAIARDDLQAAQHLLDDSLSRARAVGSPRLTFYIMGELANLAYRQEDFEAARATGEEALGLARAMNQPLAAAQPLGLLAEVARAQGNFEQAMALAAENVALLREGGARLQIAWSLRDLAYAASETCSPARAAELFVESLALFEEQGATGGIASCLAGFASLAAARGQVERAGRLLGAVEGMLQAAETRLAPADRVAYARTMERLRAGPGSEAHAKTLTDGRRMTLAAAIAEARVLSDELASVQADVGATTIAEVPLPRVGKSEATICDRPHILSVRELEVLRLVAEGRTDREIADTLGISPRTATTHLTHILNKLGLDSRTAAASYAVRHGLA